MLLQHCFSGLQVAYYLHKMGINYIVLERGTASGSFFQTFPRRRTLISINKRNTGSIILIVQTKRVFRVCYKLLYLIAQIRKLP